MKKLVLFVSLVTSPALFAQSQKEIPLRSHTLVVDYEVFSGKAVCWQTCRHMGCEEASFALFMDSHLYALTQRAAEQGLRWRLEPGKTCGYEGSIALVDVHMPNLQRKDSARSAEILEKKGSDVKIMIHSNYLRDAARFFSEEFKKRK